MGRGAVLAGVLAALSAGCAGLGPRPFDGPDARRWEQRRELSRQARAAADSRDFARALDLLARLSESDPRSADAPARMAAIYVELGRVDDAAEAFGLALKRDADDVDSLIGLGRIEADRGHLDRAIDRFNAAIEIDPGQTGAHLGRARALERLGRPDEALASYFRALRIEPDTPEALMRVASIQLDRNQPESALARLDHLVELSPDDPDARAVRGRARVALQLTEGALDDLRFASERFPGRADLACMLALAFEQADDLDAARDAIAHAASIDPASPTVRAISDRLHR
ncbi:tetratricopeptide repeat protein [Tautonia plasticadhaerens]|uniref:TPR repeat-containing protein YrrB n=1 Tax=Tautonia plasticadhaerens TaxID=2527974 RepID=A0A518H5H9_9BACT|nr:tetratricopeptide repeat protein [Tautonia plasticadhaerens]QDV36097.1 TPR repeat-containing protein YrrB [Tautonia plasticadhaerens]